MGLRMVIVLAAMPFAAAAQRGGSISPGHSASGHPSSPVSPGIGGGPLRGWRGQPPFGPVSAWPIVPVFIAPGYGWPAFPGGGYPLFDNGFANMGPGPGPVPGGGLAMAPAALQQQTNFGVVPPPDDAGNKYAQPASSGEDPTFHLIQTPIPSPVVQEEYPPLVVLKTGSAYSVSKYWVKNGNLYFVTTQGEKRCVPVADVEQVYPREKHGHIVAE
jgi:hypothetical protein